MEDKKLLKVENAYKKLKHEAYYESINLFLRDRIAEFESDKNFSERMENIAELLNYGDNNDKSSEFLFKKFLEKISFKCLPKRIKDDEEANFLISNNRSFEKYELEKINYFIDAPIELHILDILWCIEVGKDLDKKLDKYCLGYRFKNNADNLFSKNNNGLFKLYHNQYSKWRDTAILKAKNTLENGSNVLIIGMDIKECYYHIETDWKTIKKLNGNDLLKTRLTYYLEQIHKQYYNKILRFLNKTHKSVKDIIGLPIGFYSSHIISNWTLSRFDKSVYSKLLPLYYGRYVDDIMIVLQSPSKETIKNNESIVRQLFIKNGLLKKNIDKKGSYNLNQKGLYNLSIQKEKLIYHYFDSKHSHAGLKEFSKEIAKQASEFRFLPIEDETKELEDSVYDIIYSGSINKLRSVIGLKENETELSKYLSRKIIQYRMCEGGLSNNQINQLFRFYKGKNVFNFFRSWEKVITLLLTNKKDSHCNRFYSLIKKTILKLSIKLSKELTLKIHDDLIDYLNISLITPLALKENRYYENTSSSRLSKLIIENNFNKKTIAYRNSNLIRHNFVLYPLINYTGFKGNLIESNFNEIKSLKNWKIEDKLKYSPRYIHEDEIQLFTLLKALLKHKDISQYQTILEILNKSFNFSQVYEIKDKAFNEKITESRINFKGSDNLSTSSIIIGIVNMKVTQDNIERAYKPGQIPNLSYNRQAEIFELLNNSIKKPKCDLVVFPEVSIPFQWVPNMVTFARKHQIGLVFGVEHIVTGNNVHNIVMTVLPYKNNMKYNGCYISARNKNYYAPMEVNSFRHYNLKEAKPFYKDYYELFNWKGVSFSVYNCFELTDIHSRGVFKSDLDFLIAVSWNKDVNYYDNIIGASVRDLHCYVIHSNTSQYGDSRISAPTKTESMNIVRVTGGLNSTLLKAKLNLNDLRDFQIKNFDQNDKRFKPTPAGYDREKAKKRMGII